MEHAFRLDDLSAVCVAEAGGEHAEQEFIKPAV